MGKVFGIDLGATYSNIAYIDENGRPVVLKNAEGDLATPSVVYFKSPTEIYVGAEAKEISMLYPDQVVSFSKKYLGMEGYSLLINEDEYTPAVISGYILKKLVNDAKDTLAMEGRLEDGEDIKDAVITCPAYFDGNGKRALIEAGRIAGLNILSILNDPAAAAIGYGATVTNQEKTILIYDLGGSTFDVSMIRIRPDSIRILDTNRDPYLGGIDWDNFIIQYLQEQFQTATGSETDLQDDPETFQELTLRAERVKKQLGEKMSVFVPVVSDGVLAKIKITRAEFEDMTEGLLQRTIDLTKDLFAEAEKMGYRQSDVSEILLTGGSSRMPQVKKRLEEEFGIDVKMFDPEGAAAKGAAIYANLLNHSA